MKKVAIYCRLSEEDKYKDNGVDSESIQNQKRMLVNYVLAQGWEVYKIYSDDDYCGADRSRPAFRELLEDARNKCFEIVLCKTQSRFTRELELVEKYIHTEFPKWGIRFIGLVDNADTDNKGNKKARQINGLINEWYLEDMSENIKQVLTDKRKHGYFIGAFAPYGYKKDKSKKGHLVVDEEAASIVKKIFRLFVSGYGKKAIADYLNNLGVPNPTAYKKLHGERFKVTSGRTSSLWNYSTVSSILSNEVYRGHLIQGKYGSISYKTKRNVAKPRSEWIYVENTHEAIIEEELWNRVKELRESNIKPMGNGTINIFANKLHCSNCGYTLRRIKVKGNYYYKCPTRAMSSELCSGAFISEDSLKQVTLEEFIKLCRQYINEEKYNQMLRECKDSNFNVPYRQEAINYKAKYKSMLKQMYIDKLNGLINENEYIELSRELREKLNEVPLLVECEEQHEIIFPPKELTRILVDLFIDEIVIYSKVDNKVSIEIHWRF
ncbi:MAG: recombinase family protein [Erysipelotrichales bacterium]|nr:recombinase family protein [Erysipelotrichales bacterium]